MGEGVPKGFCGCSVVGVVKVPKGADDAPNPGPLVAICGLGALAPNAKREDGCAG